MALNSYNDGGDLLDLRVKLYSNIQDELMNATVLYNKCVDDAFILSTALHLGKMLLLPDFPASV